MDISYLLLETRDNRKFVIEKQNLPLIKTYVETFKVKVSPTTPKKKVLSIPELVKAICSRGA